MCTTHVGSPWTFHADDISRTSSGIGEALAREFHKQGFRVFATARTAAKISFLADVGIETLPLEVNDPDSVTALRDEVSKRTGGRLDYLINNAGRNYTMLALDVDLDEVRDVFETNVVSVMRMCTTFAPLLIAAKGTIVQTGSVAGVMYVLSIWFHIGNRYANDETAGHTSHHQYTTPQRPRSTPTRTHYASN